MNFNMTGKRDTSRQTQLYVIKTECTYETYNIACNLKGFIVFLAMSYSEIESYYLLILITLPLPLPLLNLFLFHNQSNKT